MNFNRINEQLQKIKTTKRIEDIHALVGFLVEPFGITQCKPEELFMHASIQREINRFVPAQGFRNQASAYTIPHDSGLPIDIKLFWLKKTTKANMSWAMALTPNYEDNIETNTNMNIGVDIVVSENAESVFIVLSNNLKVRVLELNGSLSLTQQEIFDNWVKIGKTINRESEHFKSELHKLLWKSFDFEPINRKFYLQLVEQFDHLVGHLKKNIDEESAKMFAVRLIGRTLFLWFLRKKQFINPEKEYFTVTGDTDQTDYYRLKLEPLFFDVLNTEMKSRDYDDTITPFLNGGLFEPIDTDFYKSPKLTFPDGFFTQFFNILNHYNFTVDEGTSEYEQVAVDPEMLGRVFENLLASLNDETGNQARKSKGAFYTPREIVDYMCEQSLIEYLKTKLPDTANRDRRIEELVTMDEATFREQDHNKRRDWKKDLGQEQVIKALDELRILDPAVGSGAFPMGMLNLLVKVYTRIDTALEKDLAQLKRDILSRSLYGVDIDQMAIQISRLRAWLSILVDMENLKKVDPLPNLDFKFVCANTLIPLDEGSNGLFDADVNLKEKLIALRDQYYAVTRKVDKEKIRKEYLKLINSGSLFASERELQLKNYNPFNPLNSSGFYDPTLMHGVDAFDVVIGNPPYVQIKQINNLDKVFFKKRYKSAVGRFNLFYFFIEIGGDLAKNNAIVSFIIPDRLLLNTQCKDLRDWLLNKKSILEIISFNNSVFDSAVVDSIILTYKNRPRSDSFIKVKNETDAKEIYKKSETLIPVDYFINSPSKQFDLNFNPSKSNLVNKILKNSVSLGEISDTKDGIIQSKIPDVLFMKEPIDSDSKKLLFGKNVNKYIISFDNNWVNYKPEQMKVLDVHRGGGGLRLRKKEIFERSKILTRQTADEIIACFDSNNFYYSNTLHGTAITDPNCDPLYILGVLNSKLMTFYYRNITTENGKVFAQVKIELLRKLPIRIVSKKDQEKITKIVIELQEKKKSNINANTSDLESQIDELVMDLYGLNEEEKEVIRNS